MDRCTFCGDAILYCECRSTYYRESAETRLRNALLSAPDEATVVEALGRALASGDIDRDELMALLTRERARADDARQVLIRAGLRWLGSQAS